MKCSRSFVVSIYFIFEILLYKHTWKSENRHRIKYPFIKLYNKDISFKFNRQIISIYSTCTVVYRYLSLYCFQIWTVNICECIVICHHIWPGSSAMHSEILDKTQKIFYNVIRPDMIPRFPSISHRRKKIPLCHQEFINFSELLHWWQALIILRLNWRDVSVRLCKKFIIL